MGISIGKKIYDGAQNAAETFDQYLSRAFQRKGRLEFNIKVHGGYNESKFPELIQRHIEAGLITDEQVWSMRDVYLAWELECFVENLLDPEWEFYMGQDSQGQAVFQKLGFEPWFTGFHRGGLTNKSRIWQSGRSGGYLSIPLPPIADYYGGIPSNWDDLATFIKEAQYVERLASVIEHARKSVEENIDTDMFQGYISEWEDRMLTLHMEQVNNVQDQLHYGNAA